MALLTRCVHLVPVDAVDIICTVINNFLEEDALVVVLLQKLPGEGFGFFFSHAQIVILIVWTGLSQYFSIPV